MREGGRNTDAESWPRPHHYSNMGKSALIKNVAKEELSVCGNDERNHPADEGGKINISVYYGGSSFHPHKHFSLGVVGVKAHLHMKISLCCNTKFTSGGTHQ